MKWLSVGAFSALLAVALGAFGAHGLRDRLAPEMLAIYQTGVQYHFYHAVGIALAGLAADRLPVARRTAILFVVGTVLFSGSLYLLTITGIKKLGMITPLGGVCFLAGWGLLALSARKAAR